MTPLQAMWRECVGIEPTGAAGGASITVLRTGRTTRPDPLPGNSDQRVATTSISTRTPRGKPETATVERAGLWVPNA